MTHLRLIVAATFVFAAGCASASGAGSQDGAETPIEQATPQIRAAIESASYTERPQIENRPVVAEAMEREFRATEQYDNGVSGSVEVAVLVDAAGTLQRAVILESSGHPALDRAALNVLAVAEFSPARDGDRATPAWISMPISFVKR